MLVNKNFQSSHRHRMVPPHPPPDTMSVIVEVNTFERTQQNKGRAFLRKYSFVRFHVLKKRLKRKQHTIIIEKEIHLFEQGIFAA